jgi:hypothetical protein
MCVVFREKICTQVEPLYIKCFQVTLCVSRLLMFVLYFFVVVIIFLITVGANKFSLNVVETKDQIEY